jgi:hypothetical protein
MYKLLKRLTMITQKEVQILGIVPKSLKGILNSSHEK